MTADEVKAELAKVEAEEAAARGEETAAREQLRPLRKTLEGLHLAERALKSDIAGATDMRAKLVAQNDPSTANAIAELDARLAALQPAHAAAVEALKEPKAQLEAGVVKETAAAARLDAAIARGRPLRAELERLHVEAKAAKTNGQPSQTLAPSGTDSQAAVGNIGGN